jgi:hypothetical protein
MAYSKEGLLGDFSGRIGNMVVYKLKGKTVIRSMPVAKRAPARGRQKETQEGFSRVMEVMGALKAFVRAGFHDFAGGAYVFQRALSENLRRYHDAGAPEGLDWLLPAAGDRAGAQALALEMNDTAAAIRWGEPEPGKPSGPNDSVLLLALNTTTLEHSQLLNAAQRRQGLATIQLPPAAAGEAIRFYLAFVHLEGRVAGPDIKNTSEAQWVE